jgi:hypothetical protein
MSKSSKDWTINILGWQGNVFWLDVYSKRHGNMVGNMLSNLCICRCLNFRVSSKSRGVAATAYRITFPSVLRLIFFPSFSSKNLTLMDVQRFPSNSMLSTSGLPPFRVAENHLPSRQSILHYSCVDQMY